MVFWFFGVLVFWCFGFFNDGRFGKKGASNRPHG
jgi:hypothetical protein